MNQQPFSIGTARVDITPNFGSPTRRWHLRGDGARITDIRWPLYARTIALSDGKTTSTVTSMEIAVLHKCHHDRIREIVQSISPSPIDNIILHNTHQHSDSFVEYEPSYDIFGINDIAFDMDYITSMGRRVATSICLAVQSMQPAHIGYAAGAVEEGIASCRRVRMDDGTIVWRNSRPAEELRRLPRGHIDPEVGVVVFSAPSGKPMAAIYNYACHPSAAGGDSPSVCSADYPGFASHIIEECTGATALFLHGCSGDINPARYIRGDSFDPEARIADAKRMGQIIAGEVLKTMGQIKAEPVRRLGVEGGDRLLPVQPAAADVERNLQNANQAMKEWKEHDADPRTALRKYVLSRKLTNGRCPVAMYALSINDVAMGFIPGEPFTEIGERIKRESGANLQIVAATCGEDPFYIPTAEAISQGGYETSYVAAAETSESLVEQSTALLRASMTLRGGK